MEEHLLLRGLDAADVRVGKGEDVLAVRLALIGCREVGHFLRVLCWVPQASFRFEKVRWRPRQPISHRHRRHFHRQLHGHFPYPDLLAGGQNLCTCPSTSHRLT